MPSVAHETSSGKKKRGVASRTWNGRTLCIDPEVATILLRSIGTLGYSHDAFQFFGNEPLDFDKTRSSNF